MSLGSMDTQATGYRPMRTVRASTLPAARRCPQDGLASAPWVPGHRARDEARTAIVEARTGYLLAACFPLTTVLGTRSPSFHGTMRMTVPRGVGDQLMWKGRSEL